MAKGYANQHYLWNINYQEASRNNLPPERLKVHDNGSGRYYWAGYIKGRQRNGGYIDDFWRDYLSHVHLLQVVLGFGPFYLVHPDGSCYKPDLQLYDISQNQCLTL